MEHKHIERLEQVVRVLEELPKEKKFDLNHWSICGTVACAVGWAASDVWFRRRGLGLEKIWGLFEGKTQYQPAFKGLDDWEAVEAFFGLGEREAEHLFSAFTYKRGSKSDVIRRLNAFIRKQKTAA